MVLIALYRIIYKRSLEFTIITYDSTIMTTTTMSRLRATRAFEDAGGILFSALAFGTTLGGLCLGVSQGTYAPAS